MPKKKKYVKTLNNLDHDNHKKPKDRSERKQYYLDLIATIKRERIVDLDRKKWNINKLKQGDNLTTGHMAYLSRIINARLERPGGQFVKVTRERGETLKAYKRRRREVSRLYGYSRMPLNGIYISPSLPGQKVKAKFKGNILHLDQEQVDPASGMEGPATIVGVGDKDAFNLNIQSGLESMIKDAGAKLPPGRRGPKGQFKKPILIEAQFGARLGKAEKGFKQIITSIDDLKRFSRALRRNQLRYQKELGPLGGNTFLDGFVITELEPPKNGHGAMKGDIYK